MRVLLLHNPNAGDEEHDREALTRIFERASHQVTYQSTKVKGWKQRLDPAMDVFLAAGGDGTIRRVAIALAEMAERPAVPLAVLPLGTANNIARALGVAGSAEAIAAGLDGGRRTQLAVGIARGPWGEGRFVESAGIGLFAAMIRGSRGEQEKLYATGALDERGARLAMGADMLRRVLRGASPRAIRVEADGRDLSGDFLLAEAMNITSIGPCVRLAPGADHTGEFLDLVLAGEAERPHLEAYFAWLGDCAGTASPIPARRVRRVTLGWPATEGHLDDQLWPDDISTGAVASGEVSLEIDTVLPLLIPAED